MHDSRCTFTLQDLKPSIPHGLKTTVAIKTTHQNIHPIMDWASFAHQSPAPAIASWARCPASCPPGAWAARHAPAASTAALRCEGSAGSEAGSPRIRARPRRSYGSLQSYQSEAAVVVQTQLTSDHRPLISHHRTMKVHRVHKASLRTSRMDAL